MKTIKRINTANLISKPKILKTISILMMIIPFIGLVLLCGYLLFTVCPILAVLFLSFIIGTFMFFYLNDKDLWG